MLVSRPYIEHLGYWFFPGSPICVSSKKGSFNNFMCHPAQAARRIRSAGFPSLQHPFVFYPFSMRSSYRSNVVHVYLYLAIDLLNNVRSILIISPQLSVHLLQTPLVSCKISDFFVRENQLPGSVGTLQSLMHVAPQMPWIKITQCYVLAFLFAWKPLSVEKHTIHPFLPKEMNVYTKHKIIWFALNGWEK